jgi:cell division septal protein FtsQ
MTIVRRDHRRHRHDASSALTRAERTAEIRRARALSHLRRLRGQQPPVEPRRAIFAATAALSLAAGAGFGVSLASGAGFFGTGAQLETISVLGTGRLAAAEVAVASGVSRSVALSAVESDSVEKTLEGHAWITEARALRLPTGTLLIDVEETVPVAVVAAGAPAQTYVVDAGGAPFAVAETHHEEALPRIVTADAVAPLEPNEDIARAVQLARDVHGFGLARPVMVSIAAAGDSRGFTIRLEGLRASIVLGREDLDAKLQELVRVLAADVPGIGDATELDLRFADQAVLRNDPPPEEAAQAAAARGLATPSI